MEKCSAAKAADASDAKQGETNSTDANNSADGKQGGDFGGSQGPNAQNHCGGSDANNKRAADNQPVPGAMQQCAQAANKCTGKESVGQQAKSKGAEFSQEIAGLQSSAAQMTQKCAQSDKNNSQMPQMPQIPQMPQSSQGSGSGTTNPSTDSGASGLASNGSSTDTSTGTGTTGTSVFNPSTSNVSDSHLHPGSFFVSSPNGPATPGQAVNSGGGRGTEAASTSGVSAGGTAPSAHDSGAASAGGGAGAGAGASGGLGALGGSGGAAGASGKSADGIAGAEIKPQSGSEYNLGGGKSILGIKSNAASDDPLANLGLPDATKVEANSTPNPASLAPENRALASVKEAVTALAKDPTSLFVLLHKRYRSLRDLGRI